MGLLRMLEFVLIIIDSIASTILALLALRYTARPRLEVTFDHGKRRTRLPPNTRITLKMLVWNKGHIYAKPAAHGVIGWINFPEDFFRRGGELLEIRYGPKDKKHTNREVKPGVGRRRYIAIKKPGIVVYPQEPPEEVEIDMLTPDGGEYRIEIPLYSDEGDCGFSKLLLMVNDNEKGE